MQPLKVGLQVDFNDAVSAKIVRLDELMSFNAIESVGLCLRVNK